MYEKAIQKLEADVRSHIRLEHEMKIHMDYLEGKVEKFEKEKESNELELHSLRSEAQKSIQKVQELSKALK